MKTLRATVYCSRCGDQLSANENQQTCGTVCAFCEAIYAEAKEIHNTTHQSKKCEAISSLKIVSQYPDNLAAENLALAP